ncbi:MAG: TraR/DksA C4-type zinc finger protein [Pseudomonadota bacterium]
MMTIPNANVSMAEPDPRTALLRLHDELMKEAEALRHSTATVELDQTRQGRLTRMDAMQAQQIAIAAARRNQLRIRQVKAALTRLDNGEYGECIICGELIDPRRLRVDPTSTRCVPCLERGE